MDDLTGPDVATAAPTLSRQVSRAMLWNATLQPARIVAGLISGLVVANVLSPDEYGVTAQLGAMAATIGLVIDFGVERALVKFLPEIEARYGRDGVRHALWAVIAQKLAVILLVTVAALIFHQRFFDFWNSRVQEATVLALINKHRWIFFAALLALIVLGAFFDVYMQALVSYFRQRSWNAINLVTTILKPLLLVGVVLLGWGVLGIVGAMVAIPAVATVLAAWQTATVRRALTARPTQPATGARLLPRFGEYSALSYWIQLTEYAYSLDFVVLLLAGAQASGFKIVNSLIGQVLTALWSPLVGVQIPLFSRIYARNDNRQLNEAYQILSKFLAALLLPAAVGLTLLAGNLLATLLPKYTSFTLVARILAICLCLDAAISVPLAILMAYERYRPMLVARTCALLAVPALLLVAPRYGAVGAALVIGVARLATDGLAMILALRLLPLRYPIGFVTRVAFASAAMALGVAPLALGVLTPPPGLDPGPRLGYLLANLAVAGVGAAVYLLAFRLTGGLDPADRRRLRELRLPAGNFVLRLF